MWGTSKPSAGAAWTAIFRQAFRDSRIRTVAFGYVFIVYAWVQAAGFHSTYPTLADRTAFARSFAGNPAIRLFYGYPYDVVTVGGYSAWRVGGTLALAAAAFGMLAAVRALRAQEDAGQWEIILCGCVGRRAVFWVSMAAVGAGAVVLWVAEFAGFLVGGLAVGGSAYLALATVSVIPLFAGVGALASQLAPSRRIAVQLGGAAVVVCWLLRVVADTWAGGRWVRWLTPLGWAEQLRPFAAARPAVLVLPLVSSGLLMLLAARIAAHRDVGAGLLPARDTARPRLGLLGSPTGLALRGERGQLAVWAGGLAALAIVLGMVSTSVSTAGIPEKLRHDLARFGSGSITTPTGYLAFVFIVVMLAGCLFGISQVGAAGEEESAGRLETLLALPSGRRRWLGGRLAIGAAAVAVLCVLTGFCMWAGAALQSVDVSLPRMLEAGLNCLPISLLFLGIAAIGYAFAPRVGAAMGYGLLAVAFVWYLVGSLVAAPRWAVSLTPFGHVGLVPVQPFQPVAAAVMLAAGLLAAGLALVVFGRRDLHEA